MILSLHHEIIFHIGLFSGDVINIHDKQEDGWWLGELNGIIGIFPATYVEEASSAENNSTD